MTKTKKRVLIALTGVFVLALGFMAVLSSYTTLSYQAASMALNPIEKALKAMPWGNVAFNNPQTIAYGQSTVVQLLLSGNETGEKLLSLVDEDGEKETYRVRFSNDMEAHLVGKAFDIFPVTQERQAVSRVGVAEWKWEVRAKELGQQRLFLTLNAHLLVNDRNMQHTVESFNRTLDVQVVWPQSAMYFLSSYWQWICTAVALPFIGWIAARIFRSAKPSE